MNEVHADIESIGRFKGRGAAPRPDFGSEPGPQSCLFHPGLQSVCLIPADVCHSSSSRLCSALKLAQMFFLLQLFYPSASKSDHLCSEICPGAQAALQTHPCHTCWHRRADFRQNYIRIRTNCSNHTL